MVSHTAVAPEVEGFCEEKKSQAATGRTLRDETNADLCNLLPLKQKRCLQPIGAQSGSMRAIGVAWHGDSKHLVSISQAGMVVLWDAVNSCARQFAHRPLASAVAVAPSTDVDETVVAVGGMDNAISLLNLSPNLPKGEQVERLPAIGTSHDALISALSFMSKESLVTAGGDGDVRVWSLAKGQTTQVLRGHQKDVVGLAVGSDASGAEGGKASVASVSLDGTVRIWDLRANCESHVFQCWPESRSAEAEMAAVSIFPTGNAVAAGGVDGTVRLFDMRAYATVAELTAKPVAAPITGIECSLSGRAIYTSHADATLGVWEPFGEAGRVHKLVAYRSHDPARLSLVGLSRAPDGCALAAAGYDSNVRVYGAKVDPKLAAATK